MTTVNFRDFSGLENFSLKFQDFPECVETLLYPFQPGNDYYLLLTSCLTHCAQK